MAVSGEHLHLEKSLILNTCRRLRMGTEGYESKSGGQRKISKGRRERCDKRMDAALFY